VVRHQLSLGAHDLYLAEIVAVQYDEDVLDARGRVQSGKLEPIAYVEGEYWSLGERIGTYGGAARASGRR
jgi:flavin reductase (DIM6/NTAB) family NADH-FMN oxidoreductase RutF